MIEYLYRYAILPTFETVWKRRRTFRFWNELSQSQWWEPEKMRQWQLDRLQELVQHCSVKSPFYSERWAAHGLDVHQLQSLEDLSRWPITTRAMLRDYQSSIQVKDPTLSVVRKATGGSSGTPLQFVIDQRANDRRTAAAMRGYSWAGGAPGTRQSHLWGVDLTATSVPKRLKEKIYSRALYRRDVMNSFQLSDASVGNYVDRINQFRPRVLVGYTNPLYYLAQQIDQRGWSIHSPRSVIVGAEKLYGFQRALIERVFAAPVFETYGCREFTLIGAECARHEGLHLSMENLIVEIVDDQGRPVPEGCEGQIVVTDLHNYAMPFVRYATGDRGVAGWKECSCGRTLPLMQPVIGRQLDILRLPDGRVLPGEFFPHLIKDYPAIRHFQAVQTQRDHVELKVVVGKDWREVDRRSLHRQVQSCLGESTQWQIREVDQLPLTPAGKLRVVIGYSEADALTHSRSA